MFRQTWLHIRLRHISVTTLVLLAGIASTSAADGDPPSKKKLTPAVVQGWIADLGSTDFQSREVALAALIEAGKPAIAPLAAAVMSSDPEVAWRAATALESIGLTGDESILAEIKTRMEKTKGTPHRDLAAVLSTLSQRWAQMQQVRAQAALVKLGATFPSTGEGMPVGFGGPSPVFLGSYAAVPTYSSGTVVLDSFSFTTPVGPAVEPAKVVEFDPLTLPSSLKSLLDVAEKIEKRLEVEEAAGDRKEEAAETASKGKDDTTKAETNKRATGDKKASEGESKEKAAKEEAKSDSASETKPEEKTTGKSDAEDLKPDEPAATVTEIGSDIIVMEGGVDSARVIPSFAYADLGMPMPGMPTAAMIPGSIQLGKEWQGGDVGLVHLAGLANITTVDIQDAPLTDKAIDHFKRMPALSSILIRGTKMTPDALMKFAKEKPGLTIRGQSRGILGINAGDVNSDCIISGIRPGGPAAGAGLQEGDLIIKLDGKEVKSFGHFTLLLMKKDAGDEITVTVKRGDETFEKTLKLDARETVTP